VQRDDGPRPWPQIRDTWWVFALAASALALFLLGFLVDLRCGWHGCRGSLTFDLLDLDGIGGLPRLFTTALFTAATVLAWRARRAAAGRAATWWTGITLIAGALALSKLTSLHSVLKDSAPWVTLIGGLVLTAVALTVLTVTGRRWGVAGFRLVVLALGAYAAVALGLDLLTNLAGAVQERVGWLTVAGSTFVEELGEAMTALLLLVAVRWAAAARVER